MTVAIHHGAAQTAILLAVAFAAGAINSVAGGGTLLTFPTLLLAGVPPIVANATNTLALVPGSVSALWGYRRDMRGSRRELLLLGLPSLVGGVIGALWLTHTSDSAFSKAIPWLIYGATTLFIVQQPLARWMQRRRERAALSAGGEVEPAAYRGWARGGIVAFQLLVAVYGGFFGAGIGIMMLAALGLMGLGEDIHRANGIKNFAAACINGVATVTFVLERRIDWPYGLLMAAAAILGGYGGAGAARRLGQAAVRRLIIVIGVGIGTYMLLHQLGLL